ncbi:MAG TPA: hypothetical protein VGG29_18235 [Caulobacteraceae bacterium]|jgi:hypothetical protein
MLALALALAGCGQPPSAPAANAASPSSTEQEYHPAPELLGASAPAGGRVQLYGEALPGAAVRVATPDGAAEFANADAHGVWRIGIAPSAAPRLFGLSMSDQGRVIQAMGYLFVAPGAVARLRAGGGAEVLTPGGHGLTPQALDYDNRFATTLSGLAAPGEPLALRVDGVERGRSEADKAGRFTLSLRPLTAGLHDFDLAGASGDARFQVAIATPAPLPHPPFDAQRLAHAWRIDWITPGGGEQTTLILDPLEPSS